MAFNAESLNASYLSKEIGLPKSLIIKSYISEASALLYQLAIDFQRAQNFGSTAKRDYQSDVMNINHCLDFIANNTNFDVKSIKDMVNHKINDDSSIKDTLKIYNKSINC